VRLAELASASAVALPWHRRCSTLLPTHLLPSMFFTTSRLASCRRMASSSCGSCCRMSLSTCPATARWYVSLAAFVAMGATCLASKCAVLRLFSSHSA
jgi:hypothetical protein